MPIIIYKIKIKLIDLSKFRVLFQVILAVILLDTT